MEDSLLNLLYQLWRHVESKRKYQLVILFILMILVSFSEMLSIGAVFPLLSVFSNPPIFFNYSAARSFAQALNLSETKQLLFAVTAIFVCIVILTGVLRLILIRVQTKIGHAIGADLSFKIFKHTLYQSYSVHISRNSSEIISGISGKASNVAHSTIMPFLTIVSSGMLAIAITSALFYINPAVSIFALFVFGGIYLGIIFITKKKLKNNSRIISKESNQVIKVVQEGLGGIRDVLIDGSQNIFCDVYRKSDSALRTAQAENQIIGVSPRYFVESLGMVLIAVIAFLITDNHGIGGAVPILGAVALGAQRLLPVLQQTYAGISTIRGAQGVLKDALVLLNQPLPTYILQSYSKPIFLEKEITLCDISFKYGAGQKNVVSKVNVKVMKGQKVGLIGTTGSGKSTLLDLIMGLLRPTQGCLYVDDLLIDENNCREWQKNISHVPQSIFLADATIAENIAFGQARDVINLDQVRKVAEIAQISDTIEKWPNKYDTLVGERGLRLSGGQRQRIGIARALYKKSSLIILDEATSALDNHTEELVMSGINSLGESLTVLMVAHRLTTLKDCSLIIEMGAGEILRVGSYDEIIGKI